MLILVFSASSTALNVQAKWSIKFMLKYIQRVVQIFSSLWPAGADFLGGGGGVFHPPLMSHTESQVSWLMTFMVISGVMTHDLYG